jgi:drug/metabolite transporter (DMT)-like permease
MSAAPIRPYRSPAARGAALAALFVVLWATGFPFAKEALLFAGPMAILSLRFGAAAALLLGVSVATRAPWPGWRTGVHAGVVGLLMHGLYLGCVFEAIDRGLPAGVTALVVGLQPLLTACVVGPVLGERVRPLQWAGCALGLGGVALVVAEKLDPGGASGATIGLALVALVGITAGMLYQRRYCASVDLRVGGVIQYGAALVPVLALWLVVERQGVSWSWQFAGSLAWMVVVLSVGTISILWMLVRRGEAVRTASLLYLVPPVAALLTWAWFGETLGPEALAGMGLTALGVALVQRRAAGERRATLRDAVRRAGA